MKTKFLDLTARTLFAAGLLAFGLAALPVFGLSMDLPAPKIFFPKDYDPARAEKLEAVLRSEKLRYLGGLTSYWEPKWSTTLVYDGDAGSLNGLLAELNRVDHLMVRVTFSPDLAKETGSALQAGSWWVVYSHTAPDAVTVRVNMAAEAFKNGKLELVLPKGGGEVPR